MIIAAAIAFLVAALLILLLFRLAFGRRLRMAGGRSRQPRLGIVDAFDLDGQRQLVLVRRDNVEHLILIGKHSDILIEAEIVRADARDMREPRGRDKEFREKDFKEPAQLPPMAPQKPMVPGVAAAEPKLAPPLAAEEPAWEPAGTTPFAEPPHGRIPPMAPVFPSAPERAPVSPPPRRAPMPNIAAPKFPAKEPAADHSMIGEPERRPMAKPASPSASPLPQRGAPTPPNFLRPQRPGASEPAAPPFAAPSRQPAAPTRPQRPPQAPQGPAVPPPDMVESLEEEMAKLLGRGDKP